MKIVKWILIISFFFLVIFVAALIWFYTSNPQKIVEILSKQTRESYALDLKVREAGFNLLKGIEIKDIQIIDASSQSNEILISFREGSIVYNPLALFFKKIEILRISVAGLETSFENITNLISRLQKIPQSPSNTIEFIIHRLEISDSTLFYNKIPFKSDIKISTDKIPDEMPIELDLRSRSGSISYTGTINKGNISVKDARIGELFNADTSFRVDLFNGTMTRDIGNRFHFSINDSKIFYENFVFTTTGPFTGDYDWKSRDIMIQNAPVKVGRGTAIITNLIYSIPSQRLLIQATNACMPVGEYLKDASGFLSGDFALTVSNNVFLSGTLALSNFQYQWLRVSDGPVTLDQNKLESEFNLKTPGGTAHAELDCADIFTQGITIRLDSEELDLASLLSNIPPVKEENPGPQPGIFKIYPADFELYAKKLTYRKFEFTGLHIAGTALENSIAFKEAQADFLRGKISGKGNISQNILGGNIVIKDCRLKEFSALFLEEGKRLYGPLSGNLDFTIPLTDFNSSIVDFEAEIVNGEIKDFFLQEEIAQTLFDIPLNDIFFDKIYLKGSLENLKLKFSRVQFDSSDIKAQAEGEFSLQDKNINVRSEISFSKSYLSELPNVTQIYTSGFEEGGRLIFKIQLEGDIRKPAVKIENR